MIQKKISHYQDKIIRVIDGLGHHGLLKYEGRKLRSFFRDFNDNALYYDGDGTYAAYRGVKGLGLSCPREWIYFRIRRKL